MCETGGEEKKFELTLTYAKAPLSNNCITAHVYLTLYSLLCRLRCAEFECSALGCCKSVIVRYIYIEMCKLCGSILSFLNSLYIGVCLLRGCG